MATLKIDANFRNVTGGITDDANQTIQPFRVNPSTYRLLTDANATGSVQLLGTSPVSFSTGSVQLIGTLPNTTISDGTISSGSIQLLGLSPVIVSDGSITTIIPGTGATNLGKAEDAAHTSGDTGVMVLGVYNTGSTLAATIGDYVPLSIDAGANLRAALYSGNAEIASIAAGGDGGSNTSKGLRIYSRPEVFNGTTWDRLRGDTNGLYVSSGSIQMIGLGQVVISDGTVTTSVTIPSTQIGDGTISSGTMNIASGSIQVIGSLPTLIISDGTISKVSSGSIQLMGINPVIVSDGSVQLQAGTNTIGKLGANSGVDIGDVTINNAAGAAAVNIQDGGNSITIDGAVSVSTGSIQTIGIGQVIVSDGTTSISTGSVQVIGMGQTVVSTGTVKAVGEVAHDAADSGSPLKAGAKAITSLSGLTMVANNDRTNLFAGVDGVQINRLNTNLEDISTGTASLTAAGGTVQLLASAGAGIKIYITDITLANSGGSTTLVTLSSGSTERWYFPVPNEGGVTAHFTTPLPPNVANVYWQITNSVATSTLYASILGFKSKI